MVRPQRPGSSFTRPSTPSSAATTYPAHETAVAGLSAIEGGDDRYYNNLFVGAGGITGEVAKNDNRHRRVTGYELWVYDTRDFPLQTGGNIFYNHAQAYAAESNPVVLAESDPNVKLVEQGGQFVLRLAPGPELKQARTTFVTTKLLGKARIPGLPYENPDGSSLRIDTDYFGQKRSEAKPTPGPFANPGNPPFALTVWSSQGTFSP